MADPSGAPRTEGNSKLGMLGGWSDYEAGGLTRGTCGSIVAVKIHRTFPPTPPGAGVAIDSHGG
jgi:hypothetical protein